MAAIISNHFSILLGYGILKGTTLENLQNMKNCTGFIYCTSPATVTAKKNYQTHLNEFLFKTCCRVKCESIGEVHLDFDCTIAKTSHVVI